MAVVVERDLSHSRLLPSEGELFVHRRVMVVPAALELLQSLFRDDLNTRANRELLVIRRHDADSWCINADLQDDVSLRLVGPSRSLVVLPHDVDLDGTTGLVEN